jgi:gamma-carbonic anhydrase
MTGGLILPFDGVYPSIGEQVFIAPNAAVIGDVHLGDHASLWFNVTVRGDVHSIRIGAHTNIQDNSCIHVTRLKYPTLIGERVTVGHNVTLHGCILEDECFIGMGAVVLDGAAVETGGMLAAGALLTPAKRVKYGELWGGQPAKLLRVLSQQEQDFIKISAENYRVLKDQYLNN